jgi:hypothetical protein
LRLEVSPSERELNIIGTGCSTASAGSGVKSGGNYRAVIRLVAFPDHWIKHLDGPSPRRGAGRSKMSTSYAQDKPEPRRQPRRGDPCYRCETSGATTMDHVFPQQLYVQLPEQALTVPACMPCQTATRLDEDYFRDFIVSSSHRNETARELWERVRRAMRRDPRRGQAFLAGVSRADVFSQGGVFLGTIDALEGDSERVSHALCKIVRGLWLLETGAVMPFDEISWGFKYVSPVSGAKFPEPVADAIRKLPIRYAGPDIAFRFTVFEYDPRLSLTWMDFYGSIMFAVSTRPNRDHEPVGAEASVGDA